MVLGARHLRLSRCGAASEDDHSFFCCLPRTRAPVRYEHNHTKSLRFHSILFTPKEPLVAVRKTENYIIVILMRIVLICVDAPIPHAYDLAICRIRRREPMRHIAGTW